MTPSDGAVRSSFRDPSGLVFMREGLCHRQVNTPYKDHYDQLMGSGLYDKLVEKGLLVPHEEVSLDLAATDGAYKVLKPQQVPFISYPYEWCFSQFKDAALATLEIQKTAFEFDMVLKDASAYNIQFVSGRPLFIDTLSFEKYQEGQFWVPYKQFCQHFLAPLVLMSYTDIRLSQLLRVYIDGIPLDLASSLLPFRTRLRFSVLSHIHLHAKSQKHYEDKPVEVGKRKVSRLGFMGLIDNLQSAVRRLKWQPKGTEWGDYYEDTNYTDDSLKHKQEITAEFLDAAGPKTVWDLGANTGVFSRIAAERNAQTVSFDIDPAAVEKNYLRCKNNGSTEILPLVLDLTNPSPGLGWENGERMSIRERGPADAALALALIHHLAISNNVPLPRVAEFFGNICQALVIEFVPKSDSQVQRLLATREDVFPNYNQESFEASFSEYFTIDRALNVRGSQRTLYLMHNRAGKD